MRQIKFRGKRLDDDKWIYGYLADEDYINNINEVAMPSEEVVPDSVGQYTGHIDKNGTEIYEGDIILCKGKYLYEVQWINDGFALRGKAYGGVTSIKSFLPIEKEVIGNIHDSPRTTERRSE